MIAGIAVPAGPGWDFANFYDTGRRVTAGQINDIYDPRSLIRGEKPQGELAFFGTPISAWLYAPLSWFSPGAALVVFKIQNTLAYVAALLLLYVHNLTFAGSTTERARFVAIFAVISLMYQPFWTIYRVGGQTTPTVFLLLTLSLVCYVSDRMFWAALCLSTAAMIKPAFFPVLGLLVLASGPRFLRWCVGIGGAMAVASMVIMGAPLHEEFLRRMGEGLSARKPWFFNSSLYVVLDNVWPFVVGSAPASDIARTVLTGIIKGLILLGAVHLILEGRRRELPEAAQRHLRFLLAVTVCLAVSDVVWEHYLAALFLPLAYVVASRRYFRRPAIAMIAAIFVLAIGQSLIVVNVLRYSIEWDSWARLLGIGLMKSGPLLLFLTLLWTYRAALLRSYTSAAWRGGGGPVSVTGAAWAGLRPFAARGSVVR